MIEAFLSLMITTTLLLGSPGPATLSLAATGAAVGFRRGYPFLVGIIAGLTVAISAAGVGLASLFSNFDELRMAAQFAGAFYIVYLALKIASSPVAADRSDSIKNDPKFRDGFVLNILNVKAYAVFLAVFSGFLLPFDSVFLGYVVTGMVCIVVATFVDTAWLWFGGAIRHLFAEPRSARLLRVFFAALMVVSVGMVLIR